MRLFKKQYLKEFKKFGPEEEIELNKKKRGRLLTLGDLQYASNNQQK